jgi:hypothetical protein
MKTIALCASLSAFKKLTEIETELNGKGFAVLAPDLVGIMKKNQDFTVPNETLAEKSQATIDHFNKIAHADGVVVVNEAKNGFQGYIGPAVLMEMAIAFFLRKPIYLLHLPDNKLPHITEINVLKPVILNNNLENI